MNISGTRIDEDAAYFIAEAGVNHNGEVERAFSLIDAAADAGADAVKFQTFSADRLVTEGATKAEYQQEQTDEEQTQYEMLQEYELDRSTHERLQSHARNRGITFLSTPFDTRSADLLDRLEVPAIKLGSGELDNKPLLSHVAQFDRPVILSTGMGTMVEIERALSWIREVNDSTLVAVLHCTSSYPAPMDEVNLRAMQRMADSFDVPVGYSDHTTNVETSAYAVAAGATVVEKHFTTDRSLPGPDHGASLEPDELAEAVELVRGAQIARGTATKAPTPSEQENVETIRKSLHATKKIDAGEPFTSENIAVLRPATGLSPAFHSLVLGRESHSVLAAGDPIRAADAGLEGDDAE